MNNNFWELRNILFITYQPIFIITFGFHIIDNFNLFINNIKNIFNSKIFSLKKWAC